MTTSLRDAVRRACDATRAYDCAWPECNCSISDEGPLFTALIDQARAEERGACAALADNEPLTGVPPGTFTDRDVVVATAGVIATKRSIAAAIRARATCATEPKEPKA